MIQTDIIRADTHTSCHMIFSKVKTQRCPYYACSRRNREGNSENAEKEVGAFVTDIKKVRTFVVFVERLRPYYYLSVI